MIGPPIHPDWPLHFHRRYERREVQTACGLMSPERRPSHREGPLRLTDLEVPIPAVLFERFAALLAA